jgi:DNA-binding XRE family transcriptional regulator
MLDKERGGSKIEIQKTNGRKEKEKNKMGKERGDKMKGKRIGDSLRIIRSIRGSSISDMSEATGIAVSTISQIEMGKIGLSLDILEKISRFFLIQPERILGWLRKMDGMSDAAAEAERVTIIAKIIEGGNK